MAGEGGWRSPRAGALRPSQRNDLDTDLMRDGPVTLFRQRGVLDEHIEWLKANGYTVDEIDCGAKSCRSAILDTVATALEFPLPVGNGLDQFDDLCYGIEPSEGAGRVIVLAAYDVPMTHQLERAILVLDCLVRVSWRHLLEGHRLIVLVWCRDPRISFDDVRVGAQTPAWNFYEWFANDRR